ncbi:hypothetical protein A3E04_02655 [Candidatus Kuenenbacteria bacterium RIFCSPHIGHO2_12_FULL_42_14]|nr:MAG: hypothetical protein A2V95_03410 [Candidatus Kuenenbacteria bacterium RBG_16_41_7]OGG98503.1 MAG: hypothetical protein A3E04_02655 [Candidatus Kuenenbacteria bacterium RIFCSPHIGHO2_12_FULL_42_14]
MLVVGASMIINLGLKTWIFTKADRADSYAARPTPLYLTSETKGVEDLKACGEKCNLTVAQREQLAQWLTDYKNWQETDAARDPNFYLVQNRQRQASTALSLILVGLPLWLFHWSVIKKDNRKEKAEV